MCLINHNRSAACACPHLMKLAEDKKACYGKFCTVYFSNNCLKDTEPLRCHLLIILMVNSCFMLMNGLLFCIQLVKIYYLGFFPLFTMNINSVIHRSYLPKTGKFLNGKISDNDDASKLYNEKLLISLISTFLLLNSFWESYNAEATKNL